MRLLGGGAVREVDEVTTFRGGVLMGKVAGVLLDIQGTLLDATNRALPGAADAVAMLGSDGIRVRYVTNIDSVAPRTILGRLQAAGISAELDEVFSPVAALVRFLLQRPAASCHLVVPDELAVELAPWAAELGQQADYVVVGDMKDGFTYARMNDALRQLLGGAQLVSLNRGRYYLGPEGPLLDTGAFAAALEYGAATQAYVIGKPSTELLRLALEDMDVDARDAVMVGDDAVADVSGGHAVGTRTVLVRTGKYTDEALAAAPIRPDTILESVADLPAALQAMGSSA